MVTRELMRAWVVLALQANEEKKAFPKDVARYIWENYKNELMRSGDMLYTWQYDVRWAAQDLRNSGVLKPVNGRRDLPWELA
ncbi:hypothetical protein BVZ28_12560 [Alcaligenes faecalis]|jgi:hypothetical protein|nr:hypothetical protein D7S43_08500 [Alcaligenes faecalis]OSZ33591.1 hypothetical protein BVZ28_12560 [Alcaligenes faecalis]OSZ47564.1 hypothetical protein BVZ29_01650 [Alcaligenes faecalis]